MFTPDFRLIPPNSAVTPSTVLLGTVLLGRQVRKSSTYPNGTAVRRDLYDTGDVP